MGARCGARWSSSEIRECKIGAYADRKGDIVSSLTYSSTVTPRIERLLSTAVLMVTLFMDIRCVPVDSVYAAWERNPIALSPESMFGLEIVERFALDELERPGGFEASEVSEAPLERRWLIDTEKGYVIAMDCQLPYTSCCSFVSLSSGREPAGMGSSAPSGIPVSFRSLAAWFSNSVIRMRCFWPG